MEILDLRQLHSQELEQLLEEENRLWRDQLRWDYSGSADLIRRFVDARALPGYAAIERGQAVGYSFFVYEDYKGLIGNLFVTSAYCGSTENELLAHVIETMQETPGIRRIEAQLMTFGSGSLEPTFRNGQFQTFGRQFMLLDLKQVGPLPQHPTAQMEVIPWNEHYFDEAARLITNAYRNHIDSEINDQYKTLPGATRFLRNIIHYPGCGTFQAPASFLAFHPGSGVLCGMILTSVVYSRVGHVTQVCVIPEFHGAGIGYELMRRSVEWFRGAEFDGVSLTVTSANRQAVGLYERMGFDTLKEFSAYVWTGR